MNKVKFKTMPKNTDHTYPTTKNVKFQYLVGKKKEFNYKYDSSAKECNHFVINRGLIKEVYSDYEDMSKSDFLKMIFIDDLNDLAKYDINNLFNPITPDTSIDDYIIGLVHESNHKATLLDMIKNQLDTSKLESSVKKAILNNAKEFYQEGDMNFIKGVNPVFTLAPHQEFVKRFISYTSFYNGLLLYHGLGSGKTCSAIGITEETRKYIKYHHNFKPIIVVASANVQSNFKLQLFDPNKLEKQNGQWIIHGCLGSSFLDEIGLSQVNDLEKDKIVVKIKKLIKKYYVFMGYIEFANVIEKYMKNAEKLKMEFQDRMIVIDEIHNIRTTSEGGKTGEMQKVAKKLEYLVSHIKYMKLIFLTGTPMFNGSEEIIFMLNILNLNDKNKKVKKTDIFQSDGTFQKDGEKKLISMANGYISYVRGDNPHTFPHLIPPKLFDTKRSLLSSTRYPTEMFNGAKLTEQIKHIDLYLSKIGEEQKMEYIKIMAGLTERKHVEKLNYTDILRPLQCLNIYYPYITGHTNNGNGFDVDSEDEAEETKQNGIKSIMTWQTSSAPKVYHSFKYINKDYEIFKYENIGKYSVKIKSILRNIKDATGVILIYSQWIYYGVLPMALALEEMGYNRFGKNTKNLIDNKKNQFSYSIICGNKELSPDINEEIDALTTKNENGQRVKVVIVSQTGTEGIDLKNIRQVHILEPWYNMNRIEQVIGRARRNCSHKELPVKERNVQMFLHSVTFGEIEPIDMYLYRLCETKNEIIGKVTKLLKEVSVDCLLNENQQDFAKLDTKVDIVLSNGKSHKNYELKDEPFTNICDYQNTCEYKCQYKKDARNPIDMEPNDISTYNYKHIMNDQIIYDLKLKFKEKHIYVYDNLKTNMLKLYPLMNPEEFDYSIEKLMTEAVYDKYEEKGKIIKIHDLLLFQPSISEYEYINSAERGNPTVRETSFKMDTIYSKPDIGETFKAICDSSLDLLKETNTYNKLNTFNKENSFWQTIQNDDELYKLIIETQFERLDVLDQLELLNVSRDDTYKQVIYDAYVSDDIIVLNNTTQNDEGKNGKLETYKLLDGEWVHSDSHTDPIKKKNVADYFGYINIVAQDRRFKKPQFAIGTGDKTIKRIELNKTYKQLASHRNEHNIYDDIKENAINLNMFLELYFRYLERTDKDTKYFYYKNEINQVKSQLKI